MSRYARVANFYRKEQIKSTFRIVRSFLTVICIVSTEEKCRRKRGQSEYHVINSTFDSKIIIIDNWKEREYKAYLVF